MTYSQTLDFLYSQLPAYHRIGKAAYKNNLDNTIALDKYLKHPHKKFKSIHVGGTNGKGSVSHLMASMLQEAGYKTGLYTSPHLKDFRERIRINGEMIPESEVVDFVKKHCEIINTLKPSFFEMTVAMAFDFFAHRNVEIAVIEVGLGGRLDSTNIINPILSVITNIGHDHMDMLGDTLEKVACEKAGIIKNNMPVIIGETQPETEKVFISRASESGSGICFADKNFTCNLKKTGSLTGERQFVITDITEEKDIPGIIPLAGDYQQKNLITLFQAYNVLKSTLKIKESDLIKGIRNVVVNTGLKGRWQILSHKPLIICDTGHNREGLEYVIRQVCTIPANGIHFVIGFVKDKDLDLVLPLFPKNARYYFTKASIERALNEKTLRIKAQEYGLTGSCYKTVNEALNAAKETASTSDLIFIGGSTFIVAEVI